MMPHDLAIGDVYLPPLLVAAVVLPTWVLIRAGLQLMAGHYGLITSLNQMPFP